LRLRARVIARARAAAYQWTKIARKLLDDPGTARCGAEKKQRRCAMNRCARNCHINCQINRENYGNGGYRGGAIFRRDDINNSRRPGAAIPIVNNETPVYYQSETIANYRRTARDHCRSFPDDATPMPPVIFPPPPPSREFQAFPPVSFSLAICNYERLVIFRTLATG